jgi:hypothetical protein
VPFILTLDDGEFSTDNLTLEEAEAIEKALEITWSEMNPSRSAAQCRVVSAVFLARSHDETEAAKMAAAITVGQARKMVRWEQDDLPDLYEDGIPKAAGGRSTSTSSGSPGRRGRGRPT